MTIFETVPIDSKDRWWVTVPLDTTGSWPFADLHFTFAGHEFWLTKTVFQPSPVLITQAVRGMGPAKAWEYARRVLSALAWIHGYRIAEQASAQMGHQVLNIGNQSDTRYKAPKENLSALLSISVASTWRMLATYREALNVNNPYYRFLGYYKVLNIRFQHPRDQIKWMNARLPTLLNESAKKRIAELQSEKKEDIADHLYLNCRRAVTHASADPAVDPDSYEDEAVILKDLDLMRALAERMLAEVLPPGASVAPTNIRNAEAGQFRLNR